MADFTVEYERESCIRGHHIYYPVWTSYVGEQLVCVREPLNSVDRFAVAVKKDDSVVGHLPKKISKICSLFLRRRGSIRCRVTGSRRYSADLIQGGMEIPCVLLFSGSTKEIKKVKKLFKHSQ